MIATGYFGVPGKTGGTVHLAYYNQNITVCGTRVSGEFQYCAGYIVEKYIECKRCKALLAKYKRALHKHSQADPCYTFETFVSQGCKG